MSNTASDRIIALFEKPEVQVAITTAATGAELINPAAGVIATLFHEVANIADELLAKRIIKGLASGLNQEKFTNELRNYVSASEENAFHIANTLRKSMLSNSPKACVIMGRILADHVSNQESYDANDIIIVNALEHATDDDLWKFRRMMELSEGEEVLIKELEENLLACLEWCVAYRLWDKQNPLRGGTLYLNGGAKPNPAAFKLIKYMDEVRQLFRTYKEDEL